MAEVDVDPVLTAPVGPGEPAGRGSLVGDAALPAAAAAGAASLTPAEVERLTALAAESVSPATRRAYRSDWARWQAWCERRGEWGSGLPTEPGLVAVYLQQHAAARTQDGSFAYSPATLSRWVSSINRMSRAAGQPPPGDHPLVATVLAGIRRTRKQAPQRREPLLLDDLERIGGHIIATAQTRPARIAAARDIAVLTAGFFGGFRRSELSALRLCDVRYVAGEGLHVRVASSKTDQTGKGLVKALPFRDPQPLCPVCNLLSWIRLVAGWDERGRAGLVRATYTPPATSGGASGSENGEGRHLCGEGHPAIPTSSATVFRSLHPTGTLRGPLSGHGLNAMIRRRAAQAGLDPARLANIGSHSLRAGMVTEAYRAGATAEQIAQQTGHTNLAVLAGYRREHNPLVGNAVTHLAQPPATGGDKTCGDDQHARAAGDRGTRAGTPGAGAPGGGG